MSSEFRTNIQMWKTTLLCGFLFLLVGTDANAVPAFARQTGENCASCHVSFPELTPFGRYFKLTGYTLGQRQAVPLAMMVQAGIASSASKHDDSGALIPKDGALILQQASVFLAGKANDNVGAFVQVSYDAQGHHTASDNMDFRVVDQTRLSGKELIYGITVHNNPTVQDVWNSSPAFGYPWFSPAYTAGVPVSTLIDGGLAQAAAGAGGYFYWNKSIYGEVSLYKTADGVFSFMRAGHTHHPGSKTTLKGTNPYWRFAYNHEWGDHSLMLGTYGLRAKIYSDPLDQGSPSTKYTDTALDFQYQYITDVHTVTTQGTFIHEKQNYDSALLADPTVPGNFGAGAPFNSTNTLNAFKGKVSYYYERKYGATASYFSTTGSADAGLINITDAASGSTLSNVPNTRGYILELDYIPLQYLRIGLQYTGFTRFMGNSVNENGNGRKARDNNALFLGAWFSY